MGGKPIARAENFGRSMTGRAAGHEFPRIRLVRAGAEPRGFAACSTTSGARLEARCRMADSATRRLQAIGLKRRRRRKTFNEIVAKLGCEESDASGTG